MQCLVITAYHVYARLARESLYLTGTLSGVEPETSRLKLRRLTTIRRKSVHIHNVDHYNIVC